MPTNKSAAEVVADLVQPATNITIVTRAGELVFRRPADATEFTSIGDKARQFGRQLAVGRDVPAGWGEYLCHEAATYVKCYWLYALGTSPAWTQLDTLRLATTGGPALEAIYQQLQMGLATRVIADVEVNLADMGEGSEPIPGDEPGSPSPETSGDAT